jgi:type VI secretion system protein ImpG
MEDLTLRYYDAEMRYLREAAKEFAQTHPDRAAMLDLDKAGTPDPYVERLFEGFAFSMGRLREKIDDDLPELTEGLVSMLWPHYLRTIPSLSVVAFTPALQAVKMAEVMPAGLEVYSRPVGPKNTVCRYRTTRDVMLNPLNISGVTMTTAAADALCLQHPGGLVPCGPQPPEPLSRRRCASQQPAAPDADQTAGGPVYAPARADRPYPA